MIVAIDGPAGAGKSSVARAAAHRLGFGHLDTGAMYRALTVAAVDGLLDVEDDDQLARAVASIGMALGSETVTVADHDVTGRLRAPEVTEAVSRLAGLPHVRAALVPLQRRIAEGRDVVVEGRDIGTVVFPDADVKIYLTAAPAERARRRVRQLGRAEETSMLEEVAGDISARDSADASRSVSPLQQARDAHLIDSTSMSLEDVVDRVVTLVEAHGRTDE